MSWDALVGRYVGLRVCIASYHQTRYWGELRNVFDDSIVLQDVVSVKEQDDQGWSGYLQYGDPESAPGVSWPELVLRFDQVLSITCVEHDFAPGDHDEITRDESEPAGNPAASDYDEASGLHMSEERRRLEDALSVDAVLLEVGSAICREIVQPDDFRERIRSLRLKAAAEQGTVLPAVRIRDRRGLGPFEYHIRINGRVAASGEVRPGHLLVVDPPDELLTLEGVLTEDPIGGLPALWVEEHLREAVETHPAGVLTVEPEHVLLAHLHETFAGRAGELLAGDDVEQLLTLASERGEWTAARDMVPGMLPLPVVHRVCCSLLEEGVPLRPLTRIVETLAYESQYGSEAERLTEAVRVAIRDSIIDPHCETAGILPAWQLDSDTVALLSESLAKPDRWPRRVTTADGGTRLLPTGPLSKLIDRLPTEPLVLIVPTSLRRVLWEACRGQRPRLTVVSWEEIPAGHDVVCGRLITADELTVVPTKSVPKPHFDVASRIAEAS